MGYRDNANPAMHRLYHVVENGQERERAVGESMPLADWRQLLADVRNFSYPNPRSRAKDIVDVVVHGAPILINRELHSELSEVLDWAILNVDSELEPIMTSCLHQMRSAGLFELGRREEAIQDYLAAMRLVKRPYDRSFWYISGQTLAFQYGAENYRLIRSQAVPDWVLAFLRELWQLRGVKEPLPELLRPESTSPVTWDALELAFYGPRSTYRPERTLKTAHKGAMDEAGTHLQTQIFAFGKVKCVGAEEGGKHPPIFCVTAARPGLEDRVHFKVWPADGHNSTVLQDAVLHPRSTWLSGQKNKFVEAGSLTLGEGEQGIILFCFVSGSRQPRGRNKASLAEVKDFLERQLMCPEITQLLKFGSGELPLTHNGEEMTEYQRDHWRRWYDASAANGLLQSPLNEWAKANHQNVIGLFGLSLKRHAGRTEGVGIVTEVTSMNLVAGPREAGLIYLSTVCARYSVELHRAII